MHDRRGDEVDAEAAATAHDAAGTHDAATRPGRTALVLAGGGVRGAYEVGVLCALVEILGLRAEDPPPFRLYCGASVGAINAAFLAANGHRGDLNVAELERIWRGLEIGHHLRFDMFGMAPSVERVSRRLRHWWQGKILHKPPPHLGRSLLDPRPLEDIVQNHIPWHQLHGNIDNGQLDGLVIPALDVATGRTHMFAELAPQVRFRPSRDPRRVGVPTRITAEHVLGSAAIPVLFPARRIGDNYFYDGGLRFNTPIAPAIRSGAERLLVISPLTLNPAPSPPIEVDADEYPNLFFLAGKLLNGLLADPLAYDLQVLKRFNALLGVLEEVLSPEEWQRVREVLVEARGIPYRRLETLSIMPSADIGELAGRHVQNNMGRWSLGPLSRWALQRSLRGGNDSLEADWASYILFDGALAGELIDLGRRDATARKAEIEAFFVR
mgnify:CR=1 FL=1